MRKLLRLFFIFGVWLALLGFYSPVESDFQETSLGFSFSPPYAEHLGLDPRSAYLEILDSFDFAAVRIPVYWDRVYKEGSYDFTEADFLVGEARDRGVKVVLSFGYRNFRWPECYAPDEFSSAPYPEFEEVLLEFGRIVVSHFEGRVDYWQIENEPFLHPHCRYLTPGTLVKIIEQLRYSDSGNQSVVLTYGGTEAVMTPVIWDLYRQADIIGASFYPRILDPLFRRFYVETYALGPFKPRSIPRERAFVRGRGKEFWIAEFQAEPWSHDPRTMSPEILRSNWDQLLSYGSADRVFVWGAEWWMSEKNAGRPEVFETAREIFNLPFSPAGLE